MKLQTPLPPVISTWSRFSGVNDYVNQGGAGLSQAARTWVANLAIYCPFWVPWHYPVKRMFWINGSSAGNLHDIGIYTWEGKRIISNGPVLGVNNSTPQYVSCDILLSPGNYYLGYVHNTATANRCFGTAPTGAAGLLRARECGFYQEVVSVQGTLPATATFATYANALIPYCGITRIPTGF